jgi:hypothetical protein
MEISLETHRLVHQPIFIVAGYDVVENRIASL